MKYAVRLLLRLSVVISMFLGVLLVPQEFVWSAPQARIANDLSVDGVIANVPFPATHVVLKWKGDANATVQLRGVNDGGVWSEWKTALTENEEASSGVNESAMILVDNARKLQARVVDGDATELRVTAIDALNGPRHLQVRGANSPAGAVAGNTPQPSIVTRSQWGADESIRRGTPEFAPVERVIIHHADTANNDPNPQATVRAIYTYHVQGNGWNDIGYNFLIDQNGTVYEGRYARNYGGQAPTGENENGALVTGAHTMGRNPGSVGISLLGNYSSTAPSEAQQNALVRMIAWEADRHNLNVHGAGVVGGHRDWYSTSCPGDVAYSLIPKWRDDASALMTMSGQPGNTPGYWIASRDGRVTTMGNASNYGSMAGKPLNAAITSMTRTTTGRGYWLMGEDGGMFSFGDAKFYGSMGGKPLNKPVVGLAPTPSGNGYWLVASDGGIFAFGDAKFYGSMGGKPLNKPVVAIAATPSGKGYWTVASDGGIFAFGDAQFFGSTGSIKLNQPIVSIATGPAGAGYWLIAADGGVFAFSVPFMGSVPMLHLRTYAGTVYGAATESGRGYYMLSADGGVFTFGDARFLGSVAGTQAASMALVPVS